MTGATVPTLTALFVQIALGLAVFLSNRHRLANQCFLLLSIAIVAWLGSILLAFDARTPQVAEFAIRQASVAGAIYLAVLNLLRLSVRHRRSGWRGIFRHSWLWLGITVGVIVLCQTKFFLHGAQLQQVIGTPRLPMYGNGVYLYSIYIFGAFIALAVSYWRDLRNATGGERAELSFILVGAIAAIAFAVLLSFVLDYFLGPSRSLWFAPFRFIILSLVIAYGIATKKILEVGLFVRRAISYTVLAVYLITLYALVWWLT
jgi:hypothetical protein